MKKGADFSIDRTHRYCLWRIWDESKPLAMFIGLNPSTADEGENDSTIRFVEGLSRFNGYGGFYMMNCWTFIATKPEDLQHDPAFDAFNNKALKEIAEQCEDIVFAWGNFNIVRQKGRDKELIEMFPRAKCITKNKNGSPGHPLYKKFETTFINYNLK